jgi:hypothetical protein
LGPDQAERRLTGPVSFASGESRQKGFSSFRVRPVAYRRTGLRGSAPAAPWPGRFSFAFRFRSGPLGRRGERGTGTIIGAVIGALIGHAIEQGAACR